jgi:hypothetical protein
MASDTKPIDVVIVPDFSGSKTSIYEKRTLLFLTSWIVNGGKAASFPLHVACIGEPPATVRAFAKICDASITVHTPLKVTCDSIHGHTATCNKLRGLEILGKTDRVLLLDADTVIFSDISGLSDLDKGIAAASDTFPRVPDDYWVKISRALAIRLPEKAIQTLSQRKAVARPRNFHRTWHDSKTSNFSYYNSGALLVPWNSGLRELWENHLNRIAALFSQQDHYWRDVIFDDEVGFASAAEMLRQSGSAVLPLPEQFNTRPYHLFLRDLQVQDIKIFHATQIFSGDYRLNKIFPFLQLRPISHYRFNLLFRYLELIVANIGRHSRLFNLKSIFQVIKQISSTGKRLEELYKKQQEIARSLH